MAQQKPGVMLYFEMRNVFEELSNEKRGILLSAILDYSEHGIQPDFRGSLRIAWASIRHKLDRDDDNYVRKSQVRRYAVYIRESKKDGVLPLPYEQWLASLPETSQLETSNDTNRYPTTTTTATATSTATSTATATTTDCCYMPAAGKPPRQPQRLIPPHGGGGSCLRRTAGQPVGGSAAAAVGADSIRPQGSGTERLGEWNRLFHPDRGCAKRFLGGVEGNIVGGISRCGCRGGLPAAGI